MPNARPILVVGDVHGHLQLALSVAHLWQEELGLKFGTILLCGDVGTFTEEDRLDRATLFHAEKNPMELEFLYQWETKPHPPWIKAIFKPVGEGGLGIEADIIMIHGNHEGFNHLSKITPNRLPDRPVDVEELPTVDSGGKIRYLPSGWAVKTKGGRLVGGVGGIERGTRDVNYPEMAWIDEEAVDNLIEVSKRFPLDLLITHQGPESVHKSVGSRLLNRLLKRRVARYWFHGHGMDDPNVRTVGEVTVVPLGSVTFSKDVKYVDERAVALLFPEGRVVRGLPKRHRELNGKVWREHKWMGKRVLVSPLLEYHAFGF